MKEVMGYHMDVFGDVQQWFEHPSCHLIVTYQSPDGIWHVAMYSKRWADANCRLPPATYIKDMTDRFESAGNDFTLVCVRDWSKVPGHNGLPYVAEALKGGQRYSFIFGDDPPFWLRRKAAT